MFLYFWVNKNFNFGDMIKALDQQTEATIWSFFPFLLRTTQTYILTSTNKVCCGTSGKIQNNLMNAIAEVIEEIRMEMNKYTCYTHQNTCWAFRTGDSFKSKIPSRPLIKERCVITRGHILYLSYLLFLLFLLFIFCIY